MNITDTDEIIIELLKDTFDTGDVSIFKAYFLGDPQVIPTTMLPAIVVVKENGTNKTGATGMDRVTETFSIRLVVNFNDYMGVSNTGDMAYQQLKTWIEARDSNGLYLEQSIMGVLRKNFTLMDSVYELPTLIDQQIQVKYQLLTSERNVEGVLTEEAHCTFTTEKLVQIPIRN